MPLISFTPGSATVTLFCNQVLCKATPVNMSEERDHRTQPGSCPDSPASSRLTEGRSLHSAGLLGSFSLQFHDSRVMVFIPCSLASMCRSSAWTMLAPPPSPFSTPPPSPEEALILHPSASTVMLRSTCCKGL